MKKITCIALLLLTFFVLSCSGQNEKTKEGRNMKTLVVYFSQSGNTEGIARKVAAATGGDLELLETVKPYAGSYQQIVSEAQDEVGRDFKRPLKPLKHNVADYDRIVVGTPTWWYKMASPVLTFLSNSNFKGKVVVPFMTNAGWPGTVLKDMTRIAEKNGARVENGHEFRFNTHSDGTTTGMSTTEKELDAWIDSLKQ